MNALVQINATLKKSISVSPERAAAFFKTGPGAYAEGTVFIGVTVPVLRKIAKVFQDLMLSDIQALLRSEVNEKRLLALIILVGQYNCKSANQSNQGKLYQFYLKNLNYVNNWNLVDASAHLIMGAYLYDKDKSVLFELIKSKSLWKRRIGIVATWYFIRQNDLKWTVKLAEQLLTDKQDLIHKAVGWMLREAGKRNEAVLIAFLNEYVSNMPRTMLRYAIERLPEGVRKSYLLRQ